MKTKILDLIDFEKVDILLEGFNKSTGFVTAILDLEGNVLSKSGWRQICTQFHRIHPETAKKCSISDTVLAGELGKGEKYHFYKCLNGLVDVAVPIVIKGEHIANLFSGQFFFEKPDPLFFQKQAAKYGFNQDIYLKALGDVPIISEEKVKMAMDFLQNMTQLISEMTFQKMEQMELNEAIQKSERTLKLFVEHSPASIAMFDNNMRYLVASRRFLADYSLGDKNLLGRSHYEVFPEISERWKNFHRRGLAGETLKEDNDSFPRADGKTDWVRWEIRPWYETENHIGGIILFSEVITEQIEAREALIESEKYNRMLFDQSAVGLALTSLDGKMIDINPAYANILGRTIEEAKELTYWEITPEKYIDQEQQQLKDLDETGYYGPYEKEYIHKDGHFVPVRLQGKIIERTGVKYIWSSVEDVSERKQAEEKLKENYALLRIAGEKAKLGGWNVNLEENRSYWSDQVASIHEMPEGYSPLVEDGINFYAPECRDKITEVFTRCAQEGIPYDEEMEVITSTQKRVWVRTIGEAVRDDKGKIVKVQGAFQDITERKLAEETLRLERSNLNSVLENMQSGIFFFDEKGENCWMNPEALRIHGFSSASDMLERFSQYTQEWELSDPTGRVLHIEEWPGSRAFRGERYQNYEIHLRHLKSGRTSDVLYSCAEVRDISGNIERLVFTILDITERKEAEDKIHEQLNELRRWYKVTLDREGRVMEMKQEVNELLMQHGEALRYGNTIPENPDGETKV